MGQQHVISRVEYAAMCGVSPSTVTRLCKTKLEAAKFGDRVDLNHPDAIAYLEKKVNGAIRPGSKYETLLIEAKELCKDPDNLNTLALKTKLNVGSDMAARLLRKIQGVDINAKPDSSLRGRASQRETKKSSGSPVGTIHIPEDIQEFADMRLRDLIKQFGTDIRFLDWLKATKEIESINEKRLKNAQTESKLVSRELVKKGVIDPFNSAHVKMLTDGAKTIALGVSSILQAGEDLKDAEEYVRDQISSFIKPVKAKVRRTLKNA